MTKIVFGDTAVAVTVEVLCVPAGVVTTTGEPEFIVAAVEVGGGGGGAETTLEVGSATQPAKKLSNPQHVETDSSRCIEANEGEDGMVVFMTPPQSFCAAVGYMGGSTVRV